LHPDDRSDIVPSRARPSRDHRYVGWVTLPLPSGLIRSLTARAEIESFHSVIAIEQHFRVGDAIKGEDTPYRGAYTVFLALPSPQAFASECDALLSIHHFEME
jgi:hypothetical protein